MPEINGAQHQVDNPTGEATALTIAPLAGGIDADTATLVIEELN